MSRLVRSHALSRSDFLLLLLSSYIDVLFSNADEVVRIHLFFYYPDCCDNCATMDPLNVKSRTSFLSMTASRAGRH
jgi:hypothetical protein